MKANFCESLLLRASVPTRSACAGLSSRLQTTPLARGKIEELQSNLLWLASYMVLEPVLLLLLPPFLPRMVDSRLLVNE